LPYEREVTSFSGLMKEARVLDEDSGIRLSGTLRGQRCLVFVTRFGPRYTMMVYSLKAGTGTPDKRLETIGIDTPAALAKALRPVVGARVRAYIY
jgi:hypothetical protein